MNPALSVIAFTTLSGAGYGLLIWLGVLLPFHRQPPLPPQFGPLAIGLALVLITAGLVASLWHLGHPERAWRALSQWRTSWLSREGLAAVVCYLPALAVLAVLLGFLPSAWLIWLGPMMSLCALMTVICTAMIYASLVTVPMWRDWRVVPLYVLFALASGAVLLLPVLNLAAPMLALTMPATTAQAALFLAFVVRWWQRRQWRDRASIPSLAAATGLPSGATAHVFEGAHTEDSFITREMVFRFARKHADALSVAAIVLGVAFAGGLLEQAIDQARGLRFGFVLAAICAYAGIFLDRWLFFAEARHVVSVYFEKR